MSKQSIPDEVRRVVLAVLELPETGGGDIDRAAQPAWDSLKNLEVFFALEDAFGVEFDEDDFVRLASTDAIATAIADKTNGDSDAS